MMKYYPAWGWRDSSVSMYLARLRTRGWPADLYKKSGMMAGACNPSTRAVGTGRFLELMNSRQRRATLSKNKEEVSQVDL